MKIGKKIRIGVLPVVFLLMLAGIGVLYVQSDSFQEFARAFLVSRIEKATGLQCRMEHFSLDPFRGKYEITGLELLQRNTGSGLVRMQVPRIGASLSVSSLWHLRLRLGELKIVRPHVELISGNGESSWNPEEIIENLKVSMRLEAAKVGIEGGWIRLNRLEAPFHLTLDDLDLEIRYVKTLPGYKVHVKYRGSRIFWEQRDILHGLDLNANLSLKGLAIESFTLDRSASGTGTLLTGNGSLTDWKAPVLFIHTSGSLDARDLVLATPTLYQGRGHIGIVGDLRYDKNGIYAKGNFSSKAGAYRKMSFNGLAGSYEIRSDVLHLRNVTGRIADGGILVNADIQL